MAKPETDKAASPKETLMVVFKNDLTKMVPWLEKLLPKGGVARFQQMTNTAIMRDQKLLECTKISLFLAILFCAQKNLEPGVEDGCWIIPFKNKHGQLIATPIPAYKGLITRAVDVGAAQSVDPYPVYEHDEFYYCYGLEPDIKHTPPRLGESRGRLMGAYVTITLPNGLKKFHVMDRAEIEEHRNAGAAWRSNPNSGPWADWEQAMFLKTVIKQGLKTVPMRAELRDLLADDALIEAGTTLGAILTGSGTGLPKELEGPDKEGAESEAGPDTSVFDALVAKEMEGLTAMEVQARLAHLHENLKISAKAFKKTIPMFKEYVGTQYFFPYVNPKGESKEGFWKTFLKWEATNYPPADQVALGQVEQGEPGHIEGQGQAEPGQMEPGESPFKEAAVAIPYDDRRKTVIRKILEKAIPLADLDLTDLAEITIENIGTVEEKVGAWAPAKKGKK